MKKPGNFFSNSYFYHHGIFSVLLLGAITVTVIGFAQQPHNIVYGQEGNGWSVISKKNTIEDPDIAMNSNGDLVIAWQENNNGDYDIFAVKGNRENDRIGNPMQVNRHRKGDQKNPKAMLDLKGNFKIMWESFEEDGSGSNVFGQQFLRSGKRLGTEFQMKKIPERKQDLMFWQKQDKSGWVIRFRQMSQKGVPAAQIQEIKNEQESPLQDLALAWDGNATLGMVWTEQKKDEGATLIHFKTLPIDPASNKSVN